MLVGIDFDNTIAGYDHVFSVAAREKGLIPPDLQGGKKAIRDAIRLLPDGERKWMALQGEVYGPRMFQASPLPGVMTYLRKSVAAGWRMVVVSHKTEFGHFDPTRTNLRTSALAWMETTGLFDMGPGGLSAAAVHFESTREEKISRISELGCDVFIDDLEEVLTAPSFPQECRPIHLNVEGELSSTVSSYPDWFAIANALAVPN